MHGWTEPIDDDGQPRPRQGEPAPFSGAGRTPYRRTADAEPGAGRHRGRHRSSRPTLAGPLALGGVVTVLLVMLGVGAALLPANLTGGNDRNTPSAPQGAAAGADDAGDQDYGVLADPSAEPGASSSASPSTATPTAAAPTPSRTRASQAPASTRKSTPAAKRSTSQASTAGGGGAAADSREEQVVALVNRERAAAGCGAVQINAQLATAARRHSQDQAANNNMSHTGSDGSSFVERARRAGYQNPIGENVAMGYRTPEAVMNGWMNSDGHRRNILNCQARAIGVGVAAAANGALYWTQVFGATA